MIESKIKVLRKAAQVSTAQDSDKIWCVIAGNEEMVNNVAYAAISAKERVKIVFREHVNLKESFVRKKFDFIMLHGDSNIIRELSLICKENGGAYLKIAPYYVKNESNLILLVAPDNAIKKFIEVFPGRKNIHDEDLIYYKTLVPYNPALVLISEVKNGHVYQYDADSKLNWRVGAKFAYRRIITS